MVVALAASLSELASSRAAGVVVEAAQYSRVMEECVSSAAPLAAYRVYEQAISDGVTFGDLSRSTQALLRSRLPPEAEECEGHENECFPQPGAADLFWCDPLPSLWVDNGAGAPQVKEFDCSLLAGDEREIAIAAAWEVVAERSAPVLFRGVGAHWPAVRQWSLSLLCATRSIHSSTPPTHSTRSTHSPHCF